MIEHFDEGQPVVAFVDEDFVDEVFVFVGQARLESDLAPHDFVADFARMHTREGGAAMDELVEKDAQRPNVQSVIVVLVLDHFRSHILEGAAEGVPLLHVIRLDAPAEIADLDDVALLDQNVLRLDVSVDQALLVQIVNAGADLDEEVKSRVLAQILFLSDQVEEISL